MRLARNRCVLELWCAPWVTLWVWISYCVRKCACCILLRIRGRLSCPWPARGAPSNPGRRLALWILCCRKKSDGGFHPGLVCPNFFLWILFVRMKSHGCFSLRPRGWISCPFVKSGLLGLSLWRMPFGFQFGVSNPASQRLASLSLRRCALSSLFCFGVARVRADPVFSMRRDVQYEVDGRDPFGVSEGFQ